MKKPRPKTSGRQRRRLAGPDRPGAEAAPETSPPTSCPPTSCPPRLCPLCDRVMVLGPSLDRHHPHPRSHGGSDTVTMHKICHRAIHAMLSERELADGFSDFARLRAHPPLAAFVAWVRKRPPEYYDRTRWSKSRRFK